MLELYAEDISLGDAARAEINLIGASNSSGLTPIDPMDGGDRIRYVLSLRHGAGALESWNNVYCPSTDKFWNN